MSRQPLKTYLRLCTEFYDLDKPMLTGGQEYAFFLSYAQAARGPILEPMCGTGRFLIPMLLAGLPIEGFDASEHMLHALRQKYASFNNGDAPVSLQFVQDFQSAKRFALIFVPFGSWGLITNLAEARKSLAVMFAHLAKGGTLLLEIETIFSRWSEFVKSDGHSDYQTSFKELIELDSSENGTLIVIGFFSYLYVEEILT